MFAMVIENPRQYNLFAQPAAAIYNQLRGGLLEWFIMVAVVAAVSFVAGWIYTSIAWGNPFRAFGATAVSFANGMMEILLLPLGWRRVWAIAKLSFIEAVRGRVLYIFILFFIPFLFAGWYLDKSREGQLLFLVGFVNTAITYILLPMVIFLVSMSLPNEIQSRIVQTIVTKPVRRLEIVVGRVLGFTAIFTVVLAVMGAVSIVYIYNQLPQEDRKTLWIARLPVLANSTPPGARQYFIEHGAPTWVQLPPLMFNKQGTWDFTGTNVGKEWNNYRFHVGGKSGDSANWCFEIDPARLQKFQDKDLGEVVKAQLEFDVFKLSKGDPFRDVGKNAEASGVSCSLTFIDRGAATGAEKAKDHFRVLRVNHHRITELLVPASVFKNGRVEVVVRCETGGQYIGMAPADLYFLAKEGSFGWNFVKGLVSVWLKMFVIICVAVAASTVLKGFVTVLLTTTVFTLGIFWEFMSDVARGRIQGGGPLQSFIRLVTQNNQVSPLDPDNLMFTFFLWIDRGLLWLMRTLANVVPDLSNLDTAQFVATGVDIPPALLTLNILMVVGYVIPVVILGYFLLRNRELAA